jgi:hypothetical protein
MSPGNLPIQGTFPTSDNMTPAATITNPIMIRDFPIPGMITPETSKTKIRNCSGVEEKG